MLRIQCWITIVGHYDNTNIGGPLHFSMKVLVMIMINSATYVKTALLQLTFKYIGLKGRNGF